LPLNIYTMQSHLRYLKDQMIQIRHRPTLFEYYAAIQLTKQHGRPFYVYQDLPLSHKINAGFPLTDKGIDVVDECFQHIVQVKYYGPRTKLHYGQLATFLATPLLVGRRDLSLTLVRTKTCRVHSDIQKIIQRGDLTDLALCSTAFLRSTR
jgi:hypothetical protein